MSKYFKYAIGEILLVVIGILIALQINNWNTQKKDRVFETKMLTEIVKALTEDQSHVTTMLERIEKLDTTLNYFMILSKNRSAYDKIHFRSIFGLNAGTSFQINSGPYQAIKSSGMDKISNDSLRNMLINFYDFRLPLDKGHFDHINRHHQNNIDDLFALLGERAVKSENGENFIAYKSIPTDIFQQQRFLDILSNIDWRNRNNKGIFIRILDDIKLLKKQITIEIQYE